MRSCLTPQTSNSSIIHPPHWCLTVQCTHGVPPLLISWLNLAYVSPVVCFSWWWSRYLIWAAGWGNTICYISHTGKQGAYLNLIQHHSISAHCHVCHTPMGFYVVSSVHMALPSAILPVWHSICHTSHMILVPSTVFIILVSITISKDLVKPCGGHGESLCALENNFCSWEP